MPKENNLRIELIIGGVAVIVALYFTALPYVKSALAGPLATTTPPVLLSITTGTVPVLPPHKHGPADAVSDVGHGILLNAPEVVTTADMWVSGERVAIANAPRTILHHVNILIIRPDSADEKNQTAGEQFLNGVHGVSIGQDVSGTVLLPAPYGSFIPKGSRLITTVMLHNAEQPEGPGGTYRNVSVSVDILGLGFDKTRAQKTAAVYLTLADNDSETHDTFTVPPHAEHYVRDTENPNESGRATFTFPVSGIIVGLGAHIHAWEGGERLDVQLNGKELQSFIPYRGTDGPWDWHTDYLQTSRRVQAGDVLTISATYSNDSDIAERGAMGAVVANFAPDMK